MAHNNPRSKNIGKSGQMKFTLEKFCFFKRKYTNKPGLKFTVNQFDSEINSMVMFGCIDNNGLLATEHFDGNTVRARYKKPLGSSKNGSL